MEKGQRPQGARGKNRLADSLSPYLLQHAENPVDWHPWCDEAFERAKKEDKPVFLSIGYSTCHWCHVMAHESFEDQEVARLMNEAFISIKVDREERPDLDAVYMEICQMMTGSGGWPLNLVLTPDRKPFFAATYIPKHTRGGRIGLMELIPRIMDVWRNRRDEVIKAADQAVFVMEQSAASLEPGPDLDEASIKEAFEALWSRFDRRYGGFGRAPKFPTPHNLLFLLRYWRWTSEPRALEMVERTLEAMRRGGIYDQVGFGFHRYSTDHMWRLPHFEKMLYDQALLAMAYTEAYLATRRSLYMQVAKEIFTYVLEDMTDPAGGFYCAQDADSEGMEGRYYLWSEEEIRQALTGQEAEVAIKAFGVLRDGNYEDEATGARTGLNVLNMREPLTETARFFGMGEDQFLRTLEGIRVKLHQVRARRARPHLDDKVLADWNGLMIAALAKAARAMGDPTLEEAAERAAGFVLGSMRGQDGVLFHQYRNGHIAVEGMLDDYAFMTWALVELHQCTLKVEYLETAIELLERTVEEFWDDQRGGFFLTSSRHRDSLVRRKEIYDGAVPSGNAVAMYNLIRLARLTGRAELEDMAIRTARAFSPIIKKVPTGFTMSMMAAMGATAPGCEVVVAGNPNSEQTIQMFREVASRYLPFTVVLLVPEEKEEIQRIGRIASFTESYTPVNGRATAYICQGASCRSPVGDVGQFRELLGKLCI